MQFACESTAYSLLVLRLSNWLSGTQFVVCFARHCVLLFNISEGGVPRASRSAGVPPRRVVAGPTLTVVDAGSGVTTR